MLRSKPKFPLLLNRGIESLREVILSVQRQQPQITFTSEFLKKYPTLEEYSKFSMNKNLFFFLIFLSYVLSRSTIYVSTIGNDSADGSFELPFRSLERAQYELRNRNRSDGITVYIREGSYDYTTSCLHLTSVRPLQLVKFQHIARMVLDLQIIR